MYLAPKGVNTPDLGGHPNKRPLLGYSIAPVKFQTTAKRRDGTMLTFNMTDFLSKVDLQDIQNCSTVDCLHQCMCSSYTSSGTDYDSHGFKLTDFDSSTLLKMWFGFIYKSRFAGCNNVTVSRSPGYWAHNNILKLIYSFDQHFCDPCFLPP